MTTRAILTYDNADGHQEIRFFKTVNDAKRYIKFLRENSSNTFYNFKIKIVKPY